MVRTALLMTLLVFSHSQSESVIIHLFFPVLVMSHNQSVKDLGLDICEEFLLF